MLTILLSREFRVCRHCGKRLVIDGRCGFCGLWEHQPAPLGRARPSPGGLLLPPAPEPPPGRHLIAAPGGRYISVPRTLRPRTASTRMPRVMTPAEMVRLERSAQVARLRARRETAGMCTQCGWGAPAPGSLKCDRCRGEEGRYMAQRRAERKAMGICQDCPALRDDDGVRCSACRAKVRDRRRAKRLAKAAATAVPLGAELPGLVRWDPERPGAAPA